MFEQIIILYDNYYNYYIDYIHWKIILVLGLHWIYNILELYEYRIS